MKKLEEIKKVELPDAVKKLNGRSAKKLKKCIKALHDAVHCEDEECQEDNKKNDQQKGD